MNQNKVQNEKVEVPTGVDMNDENYLNDILISLKSLVSNYSCVLNEASNMNYYNVVKQLFDETSMIQRNFFDGLFQRGWYCLEKAEGTKIGEAVSKLQPKLNEMM